MFGVKCAIMFVGDIMEKRSIKDRIIGKIKKIKRESRIINAIVGKVARLLNKNKVVNQTTNDAPMPVVFTAETMSDAAPIIFLTPQAGAAIEADKIESAQTTPEEETIETAQVVADAGIAETAQVGADITKSVQADKPEILEPVSEASDNEDDEYITIHPYLFPYKSSKEPLQLYETALLIPKALLQKMTPKVVMSSPLEAENKVPVSTVIPESKMSICSIKVKDMSNLYLIVSLVADGYIVSADLTGLNTRVATNDLISKLALKGLSYLTIERDIILCLPVTVSVAKDMVVKEHENLGNSGETSASYDKNKMAVCTLNVKDISGLDSIVQLVAEGYVVVTNLSMFNDKEEVNNLSKKIWAKGITNVLKVSKTILICTPSTFVIAKNKQKRLKP